MIEFARVFVRAVCMCMYTMQHSIKSPSSFEFLLRHTVVCQWPKNKKDARAHQCVIYATGQVAD